MQKETTAKNIQKEKDILKMLQQKKDSVNKINQQRSNDTRNRSQMAFMQQRANEINVNAQRQLSILQNDMKH